MKRILISSILALALCASLAAIDLDLGVHFGLRTVNQATVRDTYGGGVVFTPHVDLQLAKGLGISVGYEAGYSRDGSIGQFAEASTLSVSGLELSATYQFTLKKVRPYLKAGLGFYSYEQTITGFDQIIDESKTVLVLAGGAKFYPSQRLFVSTEIKYVPMSVKPIDTSVDLGGWRLSAGLGYSFNL